MRLRQLDKLLRRRQEEDRRERLKTEGGVSVSRLVTDCHFKVVQPLRARNERERSAWPLPPGAGVKPLGRMQDNAASAWAHPIRAYSERSESRRIGRTTSPTRTKMVRGSPAKGGLKSSTTRSPSKRGGHERRLLCDPSSESGEALRQGPGEAINGRRSKCSSREPRTPEVFP